MEGGGARARTTTHHGRDRRVAAARALNRTLIPTGYRGAAAPAAAGRRLAPQANHSRDPAVHRCGARGSSRLHMSPCAWPKHGLGQENRGRLEQGRRSRRRSRPAQSNSCGKTMAQAEHGNADSPQGRGIGRVDPKGGGGISSLQPPYHETNLCKGDGPLDCGCGWPPFFFFLFFVFSCLPRGGRGARAAPYLGPARRGARGVCTGWFLFPRGPRGGTANARGARAGRSGRAGPWGGGSSGRRPRRNSCRIAAGRSWPPAAGGHPPAGKPPRFDRWTACTAINAAASPARIAPPGAACGSSAVQAQADAGLWRGPREQEAARARNTAAASGLYATGRLAGRASILLGVHRRCDRDFRVDRARGDSRGARQLHVRGGGRVQPVGCNDRREVSARHVGRPVRKGRVRRGHAVQRPPGARRGRTLGGVRRDSAGGKHPRALGLARRDLAQAGPCSARAAGSASAAARMPRRNPGHGGDRHLRPLEQYPAGCCRFAAAAIFGKPRAAAAPRRGSPSERPARQAAPPGALGALPAVTPWRPPTRAPF